MLFAAEHELRSKFVKSRRLPLIFQLDDWYHPRLPEGEWPSRTETFRQIADVLITGDPSRYQPSEGLAAQLPLVLVVLPALLAHFGETGKPVVEQVRNQAL